MYGDGDTIGASASESAVLSTAEPTAFGAAAFLPFLGALLLRLALAHSAGLSCSKAACSAVATPKTLPSDIAVLYASKSDAVAPSTCADSSAVLPASCSLNAACPSKADK